MNIAELVAEAEGLSRQCVLLKRNGPPDNLAGVWGGSGILPAPEGPYRHWISIECRYLPESTGPRDGVLSVYTNEDDSSSGVVIHRSNALLANSEGGEYVYAHKGRSLPPPDAISDANNEDYVRIWQANCPLYGDDAVAVIGGWHFPWPDGDWEELMQHKFVLWTIEDSEPWVEVWYDTDGYRVIERVT